MILSKYRLTIVYILIMFLFSCEDNYNIGVDCDECDIYSDKPTWDDMIFKVSLNEENDSVLVDLFIGKIEEDNFDTSFYATEETIYIPCKIGRFYSAKASYKKGNQTIIAIDGGKMRVTDEADACNKAYCWITKGQVINLKLKE